MNKYMHPGLAAVLSFIFNGLGQIYNGQIIKGLLIMSFSILSLLILISGSMLIGFALVGKFIIPAQVIWGAILFITGLIFICVIGIYSILDAYRTAAKSGF